MARKTSKPTDKDLSRYTPLLESGTGLKSRAGAISGRRVYKGVTVIKAGLGNQRDRNYYPAEMLERAVKEKRFDGLRAYADHQDSVSEEIQPERTVRDMVGLYTNPRFVREGKQGGRVVADLNLFRTAKWLSDTVDDLLDMGQADKIGLSINGRGRTVEKRIQLEESADPLDVNYVEDFLVLRSGDVVTEAGAGGGFQQLLESARGRGATEETVMKVNAQQRKAIKEAFAKSDLSALGKLMKECGCSMAQAATIAKEGEAAADDKGSKKKAAKTVETDVKGKGKKAPVAEADDDAADEDDDADDVEEVDHDAELDEAVDDVNAEAEGDDDAEADDADNEGDDVEESDDEADDDAADDEDDDAADDTKESRHPLSNGAARIRQGARDSQGRRAQEAAPKGKALVKSRGQKNAKGPGGGKTAVNMPGTRRNQGGGQKGRRFGEADAQDSREVTRLREENARLSSQLRIRTTADRARNLLRESAIPEKLRPEILRLMVGKKENEMLRIVRYHERLVSTAIEEATFGDMGSGVEGAGSTKFRESHHGGEARDEDFGSLFEEVGVPTRGDE